MPPITWTERICVLNPRDRRLTASALSSIFFPLKSSLSKRIIVGSENSCLGAKIMLLIFDRNLNLLENHLVTRTEHKILACHKLCFPGSRGVYTFQSQRGRKGGQEVFLLHRKAGKCKQCYKGWGVSQTQRNGYEYGISTQLMNLFSILPFSIKEELGLKSYGRKWQGPEAYCSL